jgi:hypothetical protein
MLLLLIAPLKSYYTTLLSILGAFLACALYKKLRLVFASYLDKEKEEILT